MIRLLLVDDHTAVRAGLLALVRSEPGLTAVSSAGSCAEALADARSRAPDVAVLDYHLPDGDGLSLCRALKRLDPAPAVLLYSAYAGGGLAVASLVAGADGMLEKGAPADELFDAIRTAAAGRTRFPAVEREHLLSAGAALDPEDLPILGMVVERTPLADIASALRLAPREVEHRVDLMLRRIRPATALPVEAGA